MLDRSSQSRAERSAANLGNRRRRGGNGRWAVAAEGAGALRMAARRPKRATGRRGPGWKGRSSGSCLRGKNARLRALNFMSQLSRDYLSECRRLIEAVTAQEAAISQAADWFAET